MFKTRSRTQISKPSFFSCFFVVFLCVFAFFEISTRRIFRYNFQREFHMKYFQNSNSYKNQKKYILFCVFFFAFFCARAQRRGTRAGCYFTVTSCYFTVTSCYFTVTSCYFTVTSCYFMLLHCYFMLLHCYFKKKLQKNAQKKLQTNSKKTAKNNQQN